MFTGASGPERPRWLGQSFVGGPKLVGGGAEENYEVKTMMFIINDAITHDFADYNTFKAEADSIVILGVDAPEFAWGEVDSSKATTSIYIENSSQNHEKVFFIPSYNNGVQSIRIY